MAIPNSQITWNNMDIPNSWEKSADWETLQNTSDFNYFVNTSRAEVQRKLWNRLHEMSEQDLQKEIYQTAAQKMRNR